MLPPLDLLSEVRQSPVYRIDEPLDASAVSCPLQAISALEALDALTAALTAVSLAASSFDAELRSAERLSVDPSSSIFEALEASTVQVVAFTSALTFDALEASMEHEAASTAALILAALEASIVNLSARSVMSLVIFEALEALSERMLPPLAGDGYRDVGVLEVVRLLVEGHFEGLSLGFGDDQVDQVVVGLDADVRRLGRDDDFHGARSVDGIEIGGLDVFRDDIAAAFDALAQQWRRNGDDIGAYGEHGSDQDGYQQNLFHGVWFIGLIVRYFPWRISRICPTSSSHVSSSVAR